MEPLYTSLVSRKVTKLINYQTTGFLRKMTQKLQCGIGLNQAGSTYARGNACLFLQFTKKVGKKMIHELISAKQMESLGEKGSVQGPRNKWGNP